MALIEAAAPRTWQDLEASVARILRECGYDVEVGKHIKLARGDVNVDVWADEHSSPPSIMIVECKHWASAVTKNVVHGFRTVVGDSGANLGLIVSSGGFQEGAIAAAAYSNVRLLTWEQFEQMFAIRWFRSFMSSTLGEETDALHEYMEPINARVFRKADAWPEDRRQQFIALRQQYQGLMAMNFAFHPVMLERDLAPLASRLPTLPLRHSAEAPDGKKLADLVPDDVLDAMALRPLMDALVEHSRRATAEFDDVFGERA